MVVGGFKEDCRAGSGIGGGEGGTLSEFLHWTHIVDYSSMYIFFRKKGKNRKLMP